MGSGDGFVGVCELLLAGEVLPDAEGASGAGQRYRTHRVVGAQLAQSGDESPSGWADRGR